MNRARPTPLFRPAPLLVALGSLACAPQPIVGEDVMPLDGALHLSDMGQAEAYGRNPDAAASGANGRSESDPFAALDAALRQRWVHREIHEAEGIDIPAVVDLLRQESGGQDGGQDRRRGDLRGALERATCRLGDGSLQVVEHESAVYADSGLQVRSVGPAFLVEGTDDRYGGSLEPGDRIMAVDGTDVVRWASITCAGPGSSDGHRKAQLAQSLERADGSRSETQPRTQSVTVRRADSGTVSEVQLIWRNEADPACVEGDAITSDVGVVVVHRLDCEPAAFTSQLTAADEAAGVGHVMLDLRRVVGEHEGNAQALARRFSPSATVWATKRTGTRGGFTNVELPDAGPAIQADTRWLLLSPRCSGTCELAASAIAGDSLVTTVGRATAGSVADTEPVSVGPRLVVRVPTVQYAVPGTSTLLEGRGVTPDLAVTATIDGLGRGHDPEVVAVARRISGKE